VTSCASSASRENECAKWLVQGVVDPMREMRISRRAKFVSESAKMHGMTHS